MAGAYFRLWRIFTSIPVSSTNDHNISHSPGQPRSISSAMEAVPHGRLSVRTSCGLFPDRGTGLRLQCFPAAFASLTWSHPFPLLLNGLHSHRALSHSLKHSFEPHGSTFWAGQMAFAPFAGKCTEHRSNQHGNNHGCNWNYSDTNEHSCSHYSDPDYRTGNYN